MKKNCFYILALFAVHVCAASTSSAKADQSFFNKYSGSFSILENRGQWDQDVYYGIPLSNNSIVFVTREGLIYDLKEPMLTDTATDETGRHQSPVDQNNRSAKGHRFKVSLEGSRGFTSIEPLEEMVTRYHYYLGPTRKDWHTNVRSYKGILVKNVYSGIDFTLYIQDGKIKYDFVVGPGADYHLIRLKYEGVETQIEPDGNLLVKNSVSNLTELSPVVYQLLSERDTIYISSNYSTLSGSVIGYDIDKYDTTSPVIIDPQLVFATFSGVKEGNASLAYASTFNNNGDLYAMGTGPLADYHYKQIYGPYEINYLLDTAVANSGIGINKFSSDGSQLLHSIVIKGSNNPSCINIDKENNLCIGLIAFFPSELPQLENMFISPSAGGVTDLYLCKISENGDSLVAAAVIGGQGTEGLAADVFPDMGGDIQLEIKILKNGNIAIVSNTSSTDYPTTSDALHSRYLGGNFDGIFTVLDAQMQNVIYSSYIGGNDQDHCFDIIETDQEDLVIGGATQSTDLKMSGKEVFQPLKEAYHDGFIMKFNQYYEYLNTTYIGGGGRESVRKLAALKDGTLHALVDYPSYKTSADAFNWLPGYNIMKIDRDLKAISRSVSLGAITPSAFMADVCGNTYVSGYGLLGPTTADAIQKNAGIWIGIYSEDFSSLRYGTKYGTGSDHYHNGVTRFDPLGIIYQVVCSAQKDYPVTSNAAFTEKYSSSVEPVAFKIDAEVGFVKADIYLKDEERIGCSIPFTVKFNNGTVSRRKVFYHWDFGDGIGSSTAKEPSYTYTHPGKYRVVLTASSPGSCNEFDRDTIEIFVYDSLQINLPDVYLCEQKDSIQLIATPGFPLFERMKIQWMPAGGILSGQGTLSPIVSPSFAKEYQISISMENHCPFSITETSSVIDSKIEVAIDTNYTCLNQDNGSISIKKMRADTFNYSYVLMDIYGDTLSTSDQAEGLKGGVYYLNVDNGHCDSTYPLLVSIFSGKVDFSLSKIYWCASEPIVLNNESNAYYSKFNWFFNDVWMDTSYSFNRIVNNLGLQGVKLVGAGERCVDTAEQSIQIDPLKHIQFSMSKASICVGEEIAIQPLPYADSSVVFIKWHLGSNYFIAYNLDRITHAFDQAGIIPIILTAQFRACPDTSYITSVQVHSLPDIDLGDDSSLCIKARPITLKNKIPSADYAKRSFLWNTGSISESIEVGYPGIYSLTITDGETDCSSTESIEIREDCYIDIPNAFTPNGDGNNDYFFPRQLLAGKVSDFKMQIYNRWGQLVFETMQIDGSGWNGQYRGKDLPQDTYVYRIETIIGDRREAYKGNITLIR